MLPSLLLLAPMIGAPSLHAGSQSQTQIEIGRNRTLLLRTRLQVLSLLEVLPELDGDGDGFVDPPEVSAQAQLIQGYWKAHYALSSGGQALELGACEVRLLPPSPDAFLEVSEWIQLEGRFLDPVGDRLDVRSSLFLVTSPDHRDLVSVAWPGRLRVSAVLDREQDFANFQPGASLLQARIRGLGSSALQGGIGPLLVLSLLLAWSSRRKRWQHALAMVFGLALGTWISSQAFSLPGLHLLPLALPLGAAYCSADRAAFGMQRGHALEAVVVGALWGLATGIHRLPAELELSNFAARCSSFGACIALVVLLACLLVRPKPELGRWMLGAVAIVGFSSFAQRAFF